MPGSKYRVKKHHWNTDNMESNLYACITVESGAEPASVCSLLSAQPNQWSVTDLENAEKLYLPDYR